jgi:hypothetical protein
LRFILDDRANVLPLRIITLSLAGGEGESRKFDNDFCYPSIETLFYYFKTMSDLDRGIMKFKGADSPLAIVISSVLVLGGITILILWAMQHAYAV